MEVPFGGGSTIIYREGQEQAGVGRESPDNVDGKEAWDTP